jgi:peroxiredoxin
MKNLILIVSLLFFGGAKMSDTDDFGLKAGQTAPDFSTNDIDANAITLSKELAKGPVVIVFYRGGWCPYCNLQLRNLQHDVVPELKKVNGKLIAISVDKVAEGLKTRKSDGLDMTIVSDPSASLLTLYKVAFKLTDALVEKYKGYNIDIEGASGEKHHLMAVPSVFVIRKDGQIVFSYSNEDYKIRAENLQIIEALKK